MIDNLKIKAFNNQAKKKAQLFGIPCLNDECVGCLEGTLGGQFYVGSRIYTQILNAQCDRCNKVSSEAFEVEDTANDEYWISEDIIIQLSDESDLSVRGLGCPAHSIDAEKLNFLNGN